MDIRHDWTTGRVEDLYHLPLTELLFQAQTVHRRYHDPEIVQRCTLLSIKTGGCPEDCAYCPQSARYHTGVERDDLLTPEPVLGVRMGQRVFAWAPRGAKCTTVPRSTPCSRWLRMWPRWAWRCAPRSAC